ncbi:MAG: helix-turn-helix transcriptional regulator [Clostridia bacterium]|nr:helix-turn-helix transcriptional regulator [Clostridia bacterium]
MIIWNNQTDITDFASPDELYVNSCGYQVFDTIPFGVNRKHGRKDFHILIIKSGSCTAEYENTEYTLKENDIICYFPNQKQKYSFSNERCESFWLHFSGTKCEQLMSKLEIKNGVSRLNNISAVIFFAERLIRAKQNRNNDSLLSVAILIELLYQISDDIRPSLNSYAVFEKLIDHIHINFSTKIDLDAFASQNNISTHRLNQIFRQQTGITPLKYKLQLQLNEAKWLLASSTLNITEIAEVVGFSDPFYFSNTFKKHFGMSPSQFKKNNSTN